MKKMNVYAAIIGGGASGLMCAVKAAEKHKDKKIIIIEAADRVGKKLLVTGNGRCNLSHQNAGAGSYHGDGADELINILFQKYNTDTVVSCFNRIGLMTTADIEGRIYPRSNLASSVLDVLRHRLSALHVDELCNTSVKGIRALAHGYEITADEVTVFAEKVVVATGGHADYAGREVAHQAPLKDFHFARTFLSPSLSPVRVDAKSLRSLKGVRAAAQATLISNGRPVKVEQGEVQFSDSALSGICIFNLSRYANITEGCEISLNLLPDKTIDEIAAELTARKSLCYDGVLSDMFIGLFHKNIAAAVIKAAALTPGALCSQMNAGDIERLAHIMTDWRFKTTMRSDFQNAQVTAGGIHLSEIDPYTFESKRHSGLYLIGEVLDIDGDCGGYNLQFAFASGMCAGDSL